jgi:YVTN family beta-propeller protein
VVNEDSASVSIIDGATGEAKTVGVGEIPFAVAVNSATNKAYVLTLRREHDGGDRRRGAGR